MTLAGLYSVAGLQGLQMCGCYCWKHLQLLELQGWNYDSGACHAFWCLAVLPGECWDSVLHLTDWVVCYFVCNLSFERNTLLCLCACVPVTVGIIFWLASALGALDKQSTFTIVCLTTLLNCACINIKWLLRVGVRRGRQCKKERKKWIHFLKQEHEGYCWL